MSILVNRNTRVVVQGITGKEGSFHATQCKAYGTQVVAGVTPGKAGQEVEGIPDVVGHPSYATAIGLLRYRHMGEWAKGRRAVRRATVGRKMKEWLDEVF